MAAILPRRAFSADLLPAFDSERDRDNYVLLLGREGREPHLSVKIKSTQTSSVEICCTDPDSCTRYVLEHSLLHFNEKPADEETVILKIPAASSTRCNLTALGLSKKLSLTLDLMVAVKSVKNLCDCRKNFCSCCNGYEGHLDAEAEEVQNMLAKDFCTPVPCAIDNSNWEPGPLCNCSNGYAGNIVWEGAQVSGSCTPAPCYIVNSTRQPGLQCQCKDAFSGEVQWHQSIASGECLPAACGVPYSTGVGPDCKCMPGYDGNISWNGSEASGACAPAAGCADNVENSVGEGPQCKCKDGFTGKVLWQGAVPHGSCKAADCRIENSNLEPGPGCKCKDGYVGDIRWHGDRPSGSCTPAPCAIKNSNLEPGLGCRCKNGFQGEITWHGPSAAGTCEIVPCRVLHSDHAMLVHGRPQLLNGTGRFSSYVKHKMRWASADALPPAKCKVVPDPEHFSLSSWCAATPGQPQCSPRIVYTVTSHNASHYACDGCKTPEHALTEFRGSRCGYDLIKWESFTIKPGSPDACTCNLSSSCSEVPADELPRACIQAAEPAVLSLSIGREDEERFLIFHDTGELLATSSKGSAADVEDDALGAMSAEWLSDGENLLIKSPLGTHLWQGEGAGLQFAYEAKNSDELPGRLRANTVLPEWWKAKFKQEAALPGSFNTDKLAGCEFIFKSKGSCYSARLGQGVWVLPAPGDCVFQDVAKANGSIAYKYMSSAFGLQTYRSDVTCYPTAAFEEILVQVVDVGMPTADFDYTVARSPCRTTIRYMTDARLKLSECRSFFK
ncbi:FP2 [Symbiodinium necroappetens]|uniref:FP2 protein n=1 Tax=Symbiodinium necroappetens TaxID=1628268 RepID=A0A812K823_9DINO|nr:FP2 [Symbiodinium necroappetens]